MEQVEHFFYATVVIVGLVAISEAGMTLRVGLTTAGEQAREAIRNWKLVKAAVEDARQNGHEDLEVGVSGSQGSIVLFIHFPNPKKSDVDRKKIESFCARLEECKWTTHDVRVSKVSSLRNRHALEILFQKFMLVASNGLVRMDDLSQEILLENISYSGSIDTLPPPLLGYDIHLLETNSVQSDTKLKILLSEMSKAKSPISYFHWIDCKTNSRSTYLAIHSAGRFDYNQFPTDIESIGNIVQVSKPEDVYGRLFYNYNILYDRSMKYFLETDTLTMEQEMCVYMESKKHISRGKYPSVRASPSSIKKISSSHPSEESLCDLSEVSTDTNDSVSEFVDLGASNMSSETAALHARVGKPRKSNSNAHYKILDGIASNQETFSILKRNSDVINNLLTKASDSKVLSSQEKIAGHLLSREIITKFKISSDMFKADAISSSCGKLLAHNMDKFIGWLSSHNCYCLIMKLHNTNSVIVFRTGLKSGEIFLVNDDSPSGLVKELTSLHCLFTKYTVRYLLDVKTMDFDLMLSVKCVLDFPAIHKSAKSLDSSLSTKVRMELENNIMPSNEHNTIHFIYGGKHLIFDSVSFMDVIYISESRHSFIRSIMSNVKLTLLAILKCFFSCFDSDVIARILSSGVIVFSDLCMLISNFNYKYSSQIAICSKLDGEEIRATTTNRYVPRLPAKLEANEYYCYNQYKTATFDWILELMVTPEDDGFHLSELTPMKKKGDDITILIYHETAFGDVFEKAYFK